MTTTVVNRHTMSRPMGPDDVYVGRGTPWGNQWSVETGMTAIAREAACDLFDEDLRADPALVARIRVELKDKTLWCSCLPKRCHATTLARVADGGEP